MTKKNKSVIRPGDIPVKADKYRTVLSPVVSDLAASMLMPDPLEMGVKPPPGKTYYHAEIPRDIETRRKKVDNLLKKYEEDT